MCSQELSGVHRPPDPATRVYSSASHQTAPALCRGPRTAPSPSGTRTPSIFSALSPHPPEPSQFPSPRASPRAAIFWPSRLTTHAPTAGTRASIRPSRTPAPWLVATSPATSGPKRSATVRTRRPAASFGGQPHIGLVLSNLHSLPVAF